MEGLLSSTIATDNDLLAFLEDRDPSTWLFQKSSLGEGDNPDIPPRPYIVWNESDSIPQAAVKETSNAQWRQFNFYVYDDAGDYGRVNEILRHLRRIVKELAPFTADDGSRCSQSDWVGISGQIEDGGYHLITRFGTARFMVSQ